MATSKLKGARDGMIDMQRRTKTIRQRERGFSLLEMMMATSVLILGLVGVAQLIPASLLLNSANRTSSVALVMAQQEMDQIVNQPMSALSFPDTQHGVTCLLGDPNQPNVLVGSPIFMANDQPLIDFSQDQVDQYSFNYVDPNDPSGATWDVRWAVITTTNPASGSATGKRFIVGARQVGGPNFVLPVTLDTMVAR